MIISNKNLDELVEMLQEGTSLDSLYKYVEDTESRELVDRGWTVSYQHDIRFWSKGPWTVGKETALYLEEYL